MSGETPGLGCAPEDVDVLLKLFFEKSHTVYAKRLIMDPNQTFGLTDCIYQEITGPDNF